MKGIVKWFNPRKGYGFITPEGHDDVDSNDIFVHYTNIQQEGFRILHDGDLVEFEIETTEKGDEARNVVI
ncbi:cold-shock protein, partial [Candidatus Bathyarchaeota archaeon]|nr:cold-shock protein [Candidatus Bathyarchaeota archaeon]